MFTRERYHSKVKCQFTHPRAAPCMHDDVHSVLETVARFQMVHHQRLNCAWKTLPHVRQVYISSPILGVPCASVTVRSPVASVSFTTKINTDNLFETGGGITASLGVKTNHKSTTSSVSFTHRCECSYLDASTVDHTINKALP